VLCCRSKKTIEERFGRNDWAYVINTHAHVHHAGSNCAFEKVNIIGHENLPADMQWMIDRGKDKEKKREFLEAVDKKIKETQKELKRADLKDEDLSRLKETIVFCELVVKDIENGFEIIKPSITFSDRFNLDLGDVRIELIYFGKGHSNSDILVYIPTEKVLVTSGVCYRRLPAIKENVELTDIERHISVFGELVKDGVEINYVVPAHDDLITKKNVQNHYEYYRVMLEEVRSARQKGLDIEQVKKNLTVAKKFPYFIDRDEPADEIEKKQLNNIENLWKILDN
jgi:glyoxylase-like metal-dependent hydrolase (beta-lactamase superfamily II)